MSSGSSRGLAAADAILQRRRKSQADNKPRSKERNEGHSSSFQKNETHDETKKNNRIGIREKDVRIKVLSLGSTKTGKTCIIKRYCERRFVSKYIPTIGVDFGVIPATVQLRNNDAFQSKSNSIHVKVNFFDLSGSPEFTEIRNEFYSDVSGIFLVYDVSDKTSFHCLQEWLAEINSREDNKNSINVPIVLCGNKIDKHRVVSEKDGIELASANGLLYYETSCTSGANIDEMFEFLFKSILQNIYK